MGDSNTVPPNDVDPYATLEIPQTATGADIKSAYKRLALKHHPDKVPPSEKEKSKILFQDIVAAYAVLSDERRRRRYDTTGNTSESLNIEDDDFNWLDFYRAQWSETVTSSTILSYKEKYQGSEEEKRDVMDAYNKYLGNMSKIFQSVTLCNMLDDEERFRKWIDEEIEAGRVTDFPSYSDETKESKRKRRKAAEREAREAEVHWDELDRKSKNNSKVGDLAAMIQQRQQSRATNFLDDLEAKYAPKGGSKTASKGRKRTLEEPPEEAFERNAQKASRPAHGHKRSRKTKSPPVGDEDEVVDLEEESERSEAEEDAESVPKPAKNSKRTRRSRGAARKGKRGKS